MRTAKTKRSTLETMISVETNLDGTGECKVQTGIKYLDHMITTLSKHSLIDLIIESNGDLKHHLVEDIAIAIGQTISKALNDRSGIVRFGYATVPMDDSLASASVDLVKRAYGRIKLQIVRENVEDMVKEDIHHFLQSFAQAIEATVHVSVEYGEDDHHKVEAAFKALALSLRNAICIEPRSKTPPTAKGVM
jgi:imidazoleglycerol-phosphate dehydratase